MTQLVLVALAVVAFVCLVFSIRKSEQAIRDANQNIGAVNVWAIITVLSLLATVASVFFAVKTNG